MVAQITTRCLSRNDATSGGLIVICSRRLTLSTLVRWLPGRELGARADRLGGGANRGSCVGRPEHDRIAGFFEYLAHEPVDPGEAQLDDHRTVLELADHVALLPRPAGAVGGHPDLRSARRRHFAGSRPPVHVGGRIYVWSRLERLGGHAGRLDPVKPEVANAVAGRVEAGHVPALAAIDQRVGLNQPRGELVLVLLVVLEREQLTSGDRAGHYRGDLGVVAAGRGHLKALVGWVLAERDDHLLPYRGQRACRNVLADQVNRRDQRLGLDRQQPSRTRERIAVGLRVDRDRPVLVDFGVQDVGAGPEVDDVQYRDVLAQLLV